MVVLLALAVVAQLPQLFGDPIVVGRDHSAVAERAEVLRRVEAERRGVAEAARPPSLVSRAVGLRGILDHQQVVPPRDRQDGVEVDRQAVEMDRHDGARSRIDRCRESIGVDGVGGRIHVDEDRPGAGRGNGQDRRDEAVGRGDDFVARAHAEDTQRQLDRGKTGADANCMARPDEGGVVRLEALDRGTEDEVAARDDVSNRGVQIAADRCVLRAEIDERHTHGGDHFFNPRPRYTTGRMMLHQSARPRIFVYPSSCGG